jgi:hypothetical protein
MNRMKDISGVLLRSLVLHEHLFVYQINNHLHRDLESGL